jgi:hypothetical protein
MNKTTAQIQRYFDAQLNHSNAARRYQSELPDSDLAKQVKAWASSNMIGNRKGVQDEDNGSLEDFNINDIPLDGSYTLERSTGIIWEVSPRRSSARAPNEIITQEEQSRRRRAIADNSYDWRERARQENK